MRLRSIGIAAPRGMGAAVVSIALMFAFSACGCGGAAFYVNGMGVQRSEFINEVDRRTGIIRRADPKELVGKRGENLKAETERQVATELIKADLMRQEAKKLKVSPPADEAGMRLEQEREKQGFDKFARDLKEQGLTEAGYRKKLAEQVLVEELGRKVSEDVTVTLDEAESFYLTHKDLFAHTAMVHAAHILLDSEGQAEMVTKELENGADFTTLAKTLSRDDSTRTVGGDMGWVEKGTMDPAFEQAAFALKSGQTSGVVKASDGYHVIKVLERREAYTPPFSEAKDEALKMLESRVKEEKFSDWLRTVYANAEVDVPSSLGRWDPRLGMVVKK